MKQNTKLFGNQPNLLSNELDQVPKNRKTGYKDRIYAMKVEIEAAFDQFIDIDGDKQILNRLKHNQEKLPLHKIYKLQAWKTLSIELKREKSEEKSWEWHQAPSMPKAIKSTQYGQCRFRLS